MNLYKVLHNMLLGDHTVIPDSYKYNLRRPKSFNEMRQAAAVEDAEFVRAKRRVKNLPNAYDDKCKCSDVSTTKQKRRSENNYRDSIRFISIGDDHETIV